jgi:hypothetical protein
MEILNISFLFRVNLILRFFLFFFDGECKPWWNVEPAPLLSETDCWVNLLNPRTFQSPSLEWRP